MQGVNPPYLDTNRIELHIKYRNLLYECPSETRSDVCYVL